MGTFTKASGPPLMRLAHPLAFATFLRKVGAPTEPHFRRAGMPVLCDDANRFVPLLTAWAFFDSTAQQVDPMLAWHVGRHHGDHGLNAALLRKLETAPTLYRALHRLVRLITSESSQLKLRILERRDDILFCTQYSDLKEMPGYASSQAYQLEVYLDVIRHFLGRRWVPDEIGIEYPIVPAVVEEHFPGSRILTGQRMGWIAIPRSCLHIAAGSSSPGDGAKDSLVLADRFDYVDTLRALLRTYLSEGYPSAKLAASLMDTSVRTLHRRLSMCGVRYQEVIDEVRFDRSKELLRVSSAPIGEVAFECGFTDPAHFSRMFRRIGGLGPGQFRRANQVEG